MKSFALASIVGVGLFALGIFGSTFLEDATGGFGGGGSQASFWIIDGTELQPADATWDISVDDLTLGTTTAGCLETSATGLVFSTGTDCSSGGGGGGSFSWSTRDYGVATTTTIGFEQGLLSSASSTFSSALRLSSLSAGGLAANSAGLVYSAATTTFSGGLTYSNGNVTADLGTSISDAEVDNNITLDNLTQITTRNAASLQNFGDPFYTFFNATNTDVLSEGSSNLYFTDNRADQRAYAAIAATTTTAIDEGNNLYFTDARFNDRFDIRITATTTLPSITTLAGLTTFGSASATTTSTGGLKIDNLGLQVDSLTNCNTIDTDASGFFVCGSDATGSGGSGLATSTAIVDTYVIYGTSANDVGAEAAFTYDDSTNLLTVDDIAIAGANATSTITNALQIGASATVRDVMANFDCDSRVWLASNSVGGCVHINNGTVNTGSALSIYSNTTSSTGNLVNLRADNAGFAHSALRIDYDGLGDALTIVGTAETSNAISASNTGDDHTLNISYAGSTADKGALNLTSTNTGGSVFQITGNPTGLGVGKITHNAAGDADSSVLSLSASNAGYLGQGIFLDIETVGQAQKVLNLRADSSELLTLNAAGFVGIGSSTPSYMLGIATSTSGVLPYLTLENEGAFAAGEPAIQWTNSSGNLITARIGSSPGSSYTASELVFYVADSAKALQERLTIDVNGLLSFGNATSSLFTTTSGWITNLFSVASIDAATESTIEAAIDTLANLTSWGGFTWNPADAGVDAVFGWDDTAGQYENLTAAEVLSIVGGAATDFDASGNVTVGTAEVTDDSLTHADIADADQTDTKCIWFEDPTASDDFKSIWANKTSNDFLITEIWAESDQTVNFDLQIDDGTPADVNGTDISPASGEAEDTSLSGDTTLAAGEELDLAITSVSGTPTWVSICWTGNWVD